MEITTWEDIFRGAQIFLGFQLIIISFFTLFKRDLRSRLLGFFTLLTGLAYFYIHFQEFIFEHIVLSVIFVGPHEILDPPILFLYIVLILENKEGKILKHLAYPILYLLFHKVWFLFFPVTYNQNLQSLGIIHYFILPFYVSLYFVWGIKAFRRRIKDTLKKKALIKFKIFYYSFNILILLSSIVIFVPIIMMAFVPSMNAEIVQRLLEKFSKIALSIGMVLNQFLIVYVLSELKIFRKLFLPINVYEKHKVDINDNPIEQKLENLIKHQKVFLDPNYNVELAADQIGESTQNISSFIRQKYNLSFKDYLNTLRVNEFKQLVKQDIADQFDMVGIAMKAGFNSKASFYRIFKKMEGMTPGDYKKHGKV